MKICTSRGYFLSYLERNLHILNSDCSYLLFTFRNRFEVNYFMYRLWGSNWCFNKPTFCTINIEKYYTKKQGGRDNTIFLSDQILGFQFKKTNDFQLWVYYICDLRIYAAGKQCKNDQKTAFISSMVPLWIVYVPLLMESYEITPTVPLRWIKYNVVSFRFYSRTTLLILSNILILLLFLLIQIIH